jgi:type IV pilus assembly protein PilM
MLSLSRRTKHLPIALDIGTESIKMLQLRESPRGWELSSAGIWSYPRNKDLSETERRGLTISAVNELTRKGRFVGRKVVTALSCSQIKIKNIRLPNMSEAELNEAVKWEAKERFGVEAGKDHLNWLDAGDVRSGDGTCQEVILLAADSKTVDEHLQLIKEMKLEPMRIDVSPLAMYRVFARYLRRKVDEHNVCVVVDIGSSASRVVVGRGEQIVFIKSMDMGGRKLTEAVAKQLNLSLEEAFQLRQRTIRQSLSGAEKEQGGSSGEVDLSIHDAIRGEVEALANELAMCLRYCSVTFRGLRSSQVILSGGGAYDPAVAKLLSEHLNAECVVGRPLRGMDTAKIGLDDDGQGIFAEWGVCAGLAMENLRDRDSLSEDKHEENRLSA